MEQTEGNGRLENLIIMDSIMNYIQKNACGNAVIGLMDAKDREVFYERYGFIKDHLTNATTK